MSVRRRLFDRLGTFDPLLGPGAPFRAGEECDFMIRALAAGFNEAACQRSENTVNIVTVRRPVRLAEAGAPGDRLNCSWREWRLLWMS
jgi:hypothetical protein